MYSRHAGLRSVTFILLATALLIMGPLAWLVEDFSIEWALHEGYPRQACVSHAGSLRPG